MKIKLNPKIYHENKPPEDSILSIQKRSGLTYPTYLSMVRGRWNVRALETLTRYLTSIGITPAQLQEKKFTDVFTVEE